MAATDPRTGLELIPLPAAAPAALRRSFGDAVLHWAGACDIYNRQCERSECWVLATDRCLYVFDTAGEVARCYEVAHIGGVTATTHADGAAGLFVDVDVEQAPGVPNLLFAVPGGAGERGAVVKVLAAVYARLHKEEKGVLEVDAEEALTPASGLLATLKVPRKYEVDYVPPTPRGDLVRFEHLRPNADGRVAVFARPGQPSPQPAAPARKAAASPPPHPRKPPQSKAAAPTSPHVVAKRLPPTSPAKAPASPLKEDPGDERGAQPSAFALKKPHRDPASPMLVTSAPVPRAAASGAASALHDKLAAHERYEREVAAYLRKVFEVFPAARNVVGDPPSLDQFLTDGAAPAQPRAAPSPAVTPPPRVAPSAGAAKPRVAAARPPRIAPGLPR